MLATRFRRPVGDIGNPASFDGPVLYRTIELATPERVVRGDPRALLPLFVEAGRALAGDGATLISTSCGFLSLFQRDLEAALPVPVIASSLTILPRLTRPAVLTIEAASFSDAHLEAAGTTSDTPRCGMDGTHFTRAIMRGDVPLDVGRAEREHVAAARALIEAHPQTSDIVLECTNMGPYRAAVERSVERPAHSIVSILRERLASQRD